MFFVTRRSPWSKHRFRYASVFLISEIESCMLNIRRRMLVPLNFLIPIRGVILMPNTLLLKISILLTTTIVSYLVGRERERETKNREEIQSTHLHFTQVSIYFTQKTRVWVKFNWTWLQLLQSSCFPSILHLLGSKFYAKKASHVHNSKGFQRQQARQLRNESTYSTPQSMQPLLNSK